MNNWKKILKEFDIEGTPVEVEHLGVQSAMDTYKVYTVERTKPDYILQRPQPVPEAAPQGEVKWTITRTEKVKKTR
jgi:hypothetical protein